MTAKPFTKIVDYTKEELEDAILEAVEHARNHGFDFYIFLRGADAYFEKRHRRINPAQTRISSWQGDHSTGEWKTHGPHPKSQLHGQESPNERAQSGRPHGRPVQQGTDPVEEDPGDTPSLGSQRPRGKAKPAEPPDEVPGPGSPNPAVPNGRRNRPR